MSCDKENEKTQSLPTGTVDPSQQPDEADVASIKDGIPSDLTSSVTSSVDINAGFTGFDGMHTRLDDNAHGSQKTILPKIYYLPGYDIYASWTIVGVDGHCVGLITYFSSTGYFQQPVVHQSETLACYSLVSTSVGDQNETINGSAIANSGPKSFVLEKPNSLKSTDRNGSLTNTLSKTMPDTKKDIKIINKAPHLHCNFTAVSLPRADHQMGKFSSLANPRHHVFPPTNYRPNGRASSVNDRSVLRDKFKSSRESEMSVELTRGPRGHYKNFPLQSSAMKEEFGTGIRRDQYNLSDFQTEYETAKFYMIKSFNEDDIHKCVKYDVWTSTPNGNKKLNAAFHDAEAKLSKTGVNCPIFLFFSVNASGQFVGVAEMVGPVDFKQDMNFWKLDKYNGFFPIKWHIIKDVPNSQFRHIILQNNENRAVTFSRDTQEIGLKQGLEMLNIFKSYSAKTSLLDDFDFYEKREKFFRSQRSTKHTSPEQEVYGNHNYQKTVNGAEKQIEMQSSGTKKVTAYATSLVNLTKNLSLSSSGKQGLR